MGLSALIAFQQFGPSRGRSMWGYGKDAPLARPLTFHAHGENLRQTLELNAPDIGEELPTWECYPDPQTWGTQQVTPLSALTASAYPWWSVTLAPDAHGTVSGVRLAVGRNTQQEGERSQDPHLHQFTVLIKDVESWLPTKNPASRNPHQALCQALLSALEPTEGQHAPLSFTRALSLGAERVSVTGLSSRNAQPVILAELHAELPWPNDHAVAAAALQQALTAAEVLTERLGYALSAAVESRKVQERVMAGGYLGAYWRRIWPQLSRVLAGSANAFPDRVIEAVLLELNQAAEALGSTGDWQHVQTRLSQKLAVPAERKAKKAKAP